MDISEVAEWLSNDEQHGATDTIIKMLSEPTKVSDDEDSCAKTVPVTTHSD